MSEHDEQVALIRWFDLQIKGERIFATPNAGKRSWALANYMKAEGLREGVPDLFMPCPNKHFHGLFIEMKYGKNKVTEAQSEWVDYLNSRGFMAIACWSFKEAQEVIIKYLKER